MEEVLSNLWSIGGKKGWYPGNWLWRVRGFADTMMGGVGLRRGRRSDVDLKTGDALDFWRVLLADHAQGMLMLYAEMKLPGEAWLEFVVKSDNGTNKLLQTATFRPLGLLGRLYWYSVLPFHSLIFPRMAKAKLKSRFMGRFYFAYLFTLIPFFIVNGILTESITTEPVVWYNEQEFSGLRMGTIPFEDTFYGLLLILINLSLFEAFQAYIREHMNKLMAVP